MGDCEGIHNEAIGRRGQIPRKTRVVGLFAGREPQVLEQYNVTGFGGGNRPLDAWTRTFLEAQHGGSQEGLQPGANRGQP